MNPIIISAALGFIGTILAYAAGTVDGPHGVAGVVFAAILITVSGFIVGASRITGGTERHRTTISMTKGICNQ